MLKAVKSFKLLGVGEIKVGDTFEAKHPDKFINKGLAVLVDEPKPTPKKKTTKKLK